MKSRPLGLIISSLLFLFFPLHLSWQSLQGRIVTSHDWVFNVCLPILLVFGLLKVNRLAWYTLFGFIFLLGMRDYRAIKNETYSFTQSLSHLFIYALSLAYFINPKVKRLYFDPKLQWWRTKERFEAHGPAIFEIKNRTFYGNLKNISEGGCFLETSQPLEENEKFQLLLPLSKPLPEASLKFEAEVRWTSSKLECPGMGVQFVNLDKEAARKTKRFLRNLV